MAAKWQAKAKKAKATFAKRAAKRQYEEALRDAQQRNPEIGMGATIFLLADQKACTIVKVSASGKTIQIQEDTSIWKGKRPKKPTKNQTYTYKANPKGEIYNVFFTKDEQWRIRKTDKLGSSYVEIGKRVTFDNPDW